MTKVHWYPVMKPGEIGTRPIHNGVEVWDRDVRITLRRAPYMLIIIRHELTQDKYEHNIEYAVEKAEQWGACPALIALARAIHAHMMGN